MLDESAKGWDLPADQAIPRLLDDYGARMHAVARQFCGNPHEADDLVQEVFLLAWRNWDRFERRSGPLSWLFTIAARACQRMHRRRAGEPERKGDLGDSTVMDDASIGYVPEVLDEVLRRETQQQVGAAIATLPDEFRMPLVLKELVGASVREIAEILDLKQATVKTRLHRARMRVRDALASALPEREIPPAAYSPQVCADLLQAKHDSLDRGMPMPGLDDLICDRCRTVFTTLDLSGEACRALAEGSSLPADLRRRIEKMAPPKD